MACRPHGCKKQPRIADGLSRCGAVFAFQGRFRSSFSRIAALTHALKFIPSFFAASPAASFSAWGSLICRTESSIIGPLLMLCAIRRLDICQGINARVGDADFLRESHGVPNILNARLGFFCNRFIFHDGCIFPLLLHFSNV